jgi:DNA (cytosine-5)-methyltransferase 1
VSVRKPLFRAFGILDGEMIIDNFAGGGGASEGVSRAIGRPVDIAINHCPEAIAMHAANHPETKHYIEDIWAVDPREACGTRPVGLAWFSPDCTHYSRARGARPKEQKIRCLAWVVLRWARAVAPRIIILENVEEFESWGPLLASGQPDPERLGRTFRNWVGQLKGCGYEVEWRSIVAADYGAPTTRKRLFLIARRDGKPIVWPEPTHGAERPQPWRAAAEIIDWSLPCPSIFLSKKQGRALGVNRPLKPATLRRIAVGIQRYVINAAEPFLIPTTHQGDSRVYGIGEPLRTITGANRGEMALIEPFIVRHGHYSTITGAGLREGCGAGIFRGQQLDRPIATICATNDKHLVVPIITKHYGGLHGHQAYGYPASRPLGSITSRDSHALTAAWLMKYHGGDRGATRGQALDVPLRTIDASNRFAAVSAFLVKWYGNGGSPNSQQQSLRSPLHTITSKARFGLVMVNGQEYQITDIGMRMLQPHELFAGQGFPDDYQIAPDFNGKPLTKTMQTELCGNSVSPHPAEALVAANTRGASRAA